MVVKKLNEMNLPEAEVALRNALRNQPVGAFSQVKANPKVSDNDSALTAHTKEAYNRVRTLEAAA